jgi:hypothetical protein
MNRLHPIVALALWCAAGCDKAPPEPAATTSAPTPLTTAGATAAARSNPAAPSPPPARDNPCAAMCVHSLALHCEAAHECTAQCEQAWELETCQPTMRRALSCFAAQGAGAWACDEDGLPELKDGYCQDEKAVHAACMDAQP